MRTACCLLRPLTYTSARLAEETPGPDSVISCGPLAGIQLNIFDIVNREKGKGSQSSNMKIQGLKRFNTHYIILL
jgi:hypothetical protein